jgi:hypothetical protein
VQLKRALCRNMRFYHFLNKKYGLENIGRRRLKIARINDLNDPFEFAGVSLGDKNVRDAFQKMKLEMNEQRGLLCFSTKWKNSVMWSHYADKHQGLCLGFDVADKSVGQVSYSRKRLAVGLEQLKTPRNITEDDARKLLFTKHTHWKYESEYRAFVTLEEEDEDTGLYFAKFSDRLTLRQVIVGAESCISRQQLSEALGDKLQHVEQIKAGLALKSFSVVRQRKSTLWT